MAYIVTPQGIKLYFEKCGVGRPIIFIHPPLMGHVVFHYQKELSQKFQVILYDLRGHGRSGYRSSGSLHTVIEDHVSDLRALIEELRLDHPVIVGYSNGGLLALSYVLKYSEEISGLILSGGYPLIDSWLLAGEYQIGIWMMRMKQKKALSTLLAKSHKVLKEDHEYLFMYAMKANADAVLDLYLSGLRFNVVDCLSKLNQTALLVMYGTRDKFVSKHKKYFETLPGAEIVFIDKAFHQLPTHHYKVFNQVIEQFLMRTFKKNSAELPDGGN